jgi:hypothetical protein
LEYVKGRENMGDLDVDGKGDTETIFKEVACEDGLD